MAILAAELQGRGILTAAGEMLWGAVNHIIKAIVDHHRLVMSNGSPMSRRPAMEHLQRVSPRDPPLEDSLTVAGQLHGHFLQQAYERGPTCSSHDGLIGACGVLVEPSGGPSHPVTAAKAP